MRGVSFLRGYAMNKILGLIAAAMLFSVVGIGVAAPELPGDIEWLTNESDPVYSSPEAKKGGTFRASLQSFPLTLRLVGPDSNNAFAGVMRSLQFSLIETHPNTENIIPSLATHWAYGKDKKTMYFKLNPRARWSDGQSVTSGDFAYTLEFMRSKYIVAPWYNDYYTREIEKVTVYDDHTLAVTATKAKPDLHMTVALGPTPRHFFGQLDNDFVKKYNWEIIPSTGPYEIYDLKKGKHIKLKRKKDWWAKDLRYFKNRFNVDRVTYNVVRDLNLTWEHFKKNKLDVFSLTLPSFWHVKSKTAVIENGYVYKIWFFNDTQQPSRGLWLNQDREIFKDKNVRYAFAHAMNVERVIEKVLRNDYFRLEQHYVGYGRYSNDTIKARRFDLDKVDAYMKKSGWNRGADGIWAKNGLRFSVEVTYGFEGHTSRLVVLKEEAKKAGIELRLQKLDSASSFKKFLEKNHDVAWMGWSTGLRPAFWQHYHSDNAHKSQTNNITNTDDPELDKLIDAYRNSLKEDERIRLSLEIQAKLHEIGAFIPTFMVPYVRQAFWRWWRLPEIPGTRHSDTLFDPFGSSAGGLFWYDKPLHEETLKAKKKKDKMPPVTIIDETFKMKFLENVKFAK
jgi:microcin C transport system substrate-binding protein